MQTAGSSSSIHQQKNGFKKQNKTMACFYIRIPLSNKKQCANGSCDNMGECQKHPERKKQDTEEYVLYDSKCVPF